MKSSINACSLCGCVGFKTWAQYHDHMESTHNPAMKADLKGVTWQSNDITGVTRGFLEPIPVPTRSKEATIELVERHIASIFESVGLESPIIG
jgi:hypothetical protein